MVSISARVEGQLSIDSGSGTIWEVSDIHWGDVDQGAVLGTKFYINQVGANFLKYKDTTQVHQLFRSKKYPEVFNIIQSPLKDFFEYNRTEGFPVFPLDEWELVYDFIRPNLIHDCRIAELEAEVERLKGLLDA